MYPALLFVKLLTLFLVVCYDVMKDTLFDDCDASDTCTRNCCVSPLLTPIFFVGFVLLAQFILINVVVAVLMKHLEVCIMTNLLFHLPKAAKRVCADPLQSALRLSRLEDNLCSDAVQAIFDRVSSFFRCLSDNGTCVMKSWGCLFLELQLNCIFYLDFYGPKV
jgi:hypothetical protein